MTLVSTVGGAGGPLYGTLFLQLGVATAGKDEIDGSRLGRGARGRRPGVQARGKAELRDKTMVDALIPARDAFARRRSTTGRTFADGAAPFGRRGRGRHEGHDPARRPQGPRELPGRTQRRAPGSRRDLVALLLKTAADTWGGEA